MLLTTILLDDTIFPEYIVPTDKNKDNALTNLSKINIFIGANNAGKSRMMRAIFERDELKYKRQDCDLESFNNMVDALYDDIIKTLSTEEQKVTIPLLLDAKFKYLQNTIKLEREITPRLLSYLDHSSIRVKINNEEALYPLTNRGMEDTINPIRKSYKKSLLDLIRQIDEINKLFTKNYIPILRGLRPIQQDFSNDNQPFIRLDSYLRRTMFDYFRGYSNSNLPISTGLDFYDTLNQHKRAFDYSKQELIEEFEQFLGDTFFQGKRIQITAVIDKDVVNFRIGNEKPFPIYEVGDGIQAIILLTFPLFLNKGKDMIFFFEEPETHLHPGFQRIFIDTLLRPEFESFQYFFSSHSNHFLDITLDHDNISIYNFRKQKGDNNKFLIENVKSGDNNLLEELGVRNASVFLSNCTIWVEGISDRIYIREYLKVLMKKEENTEGSYFREDYHYSFVEYGGNNITHWSFLDNDDEEVPNINVNAICKRIFLITDQDGAGKLIEEAKEDKAKKKERQEKLKQKLGDENYHCLDCREIENALSPQILKKTIESRIKKKIKEIKPIVYIGNWSYEQYQNKQLGLFIEANINEHSKNMLNKINDNGTIHDKVSFAKAAVAAIDNYEDLSQPAKDLTAKIYAFIKKSNE